MKVDERMKNQLFDWVLAQMLADRLKDQVIEPVRPRKPAAPIQADLKNIFLRYDTSAQLNLADVRPSGFLLKANG